MSHKRKIAFCIAGTFNSGGMERVLANKANFLQRNGYDVSVITTDQNNRPPFYEFNKEIKLIDLGINYFNNGGLGIFKIIPYLFMQIAHFRKLKSVLHNSSFDIVVSMFDHEVSILPKIKDSSVKIAEIHFSRFKRIQYGRSGILGFIDKFRSKLDVKIANKYRKFVVLTEEDKGYWKDLKNIEVIPNANSFTTEEVSDLNAKTVIAVGRYDYQKRFEDLIFAWKNVYIACPDWKLKIFGHGKDFEKLQNLIIELKLKEVVFLIPTVKDIKSEYLNSSIMALSSRYEGLPMALLEAQVCGLPLVSYSCKCGPSDIILDGLNGYLVEEGNVLELSNKLIQLIKDDGLRKLMGAKSKELSQRFDENLVMKKWLKLFNDL